MDLERLKKKLKTPKYGNKKSSCLLKHIHDSALEANTCNRLYALTKKEIKGYKIQQSFPLFVKNKLVCTHIVDFWILNHNGTIEVWEAKGFKTKSWTIKKKLFQALFPEIPYRVITKDTFK